MQLKHQRHLERTRSPSRESFKKLPLESKLHIGAFLLSLITAVFAIYQYSDSKDKEFKKTFYEERFRTYTDLSDTVSKLATLSSDSSERTEVVKHYWQLVFGKAQLVGDGEVQEAINKASYWVVICIEKKGPPPNIDFCHPVMGNALAIRVSEAARNSVIRTWQVPLEKLDKTDLNTRPTR
jgi:hypothetical protein